MENVTHSIFEPRQAYNVNEKSGVAKKVDYISPVLTTEYDKYYIKRSVKFVPKPVSEDSEDYILERKIIDDKEDIIQVINTQADKVGLDAMLEKFDRTGDLSILPPPMKPTDDIFDITKLPQDNAEYFEYIHALAEKFHSLPVELRKDMTVEDFVKNITDKQVNDYLQSLAPNDDVVKKEESKKVEVKKDE